MNVYQVTTKRTDWDGWLIGSEQTMKVFVDKQKAKQYMFDETQADDALTYGHVSLPARGRGGDDLIVWSITELEVEE